MRTAIVACAVLLAAACGNSKTDSSTVATSPTASTQSGVQKCENRTIPAPSSQPASASKTKPTITVPDGAPPCKLVIQDIIIGTGAAAQPSGDVTAQYLGVSWSTRQEFDSSWSRGGQPISFNLSRLIPGWQQGIPGMKQGGRRRLIVPPELAYRQTGRPGIAPGETLIFIIDLVKAG
jgi:peptidylprolyl isomerase